MTKLLLPIILFASFLFAGELEVDGNLKVTGNIQNQMIDSLMQVIQYLQNQLNSGWESRVFEIDFELILNSEETGVNYLINEIRKYFSITKKQESYDETLKILEEAKLITDNFFDNVIVNDQNLDIKKNRLELLQMFCKTYNNFVDFSKVEGA